MDIQNLAAEFHGFVSGIDDSSIPREEREKLKVTRFIFFARKKAVASTADASELENLAFLVEKLHHKVLDASLNTLIKLASPLLPEMQDWLTNKKISIAHIGARIEIDDSLFVGSHLCNHAGGDCDCGPH